MKEEFKIHEYEYHICVEKLTIEIKFPCKITSSVKIGTIIL
jgi:hypothetical protein